MHAAIVSARRPQNVAQMEAHLAGAQPVWYVPTEDVAAYTAAGATHVRGCEGGLCAARNVALDAAEQLGEEWSLHLSDDLRKIGRLRDDGKADVIPLHEAVTALYQTMLGYPHLRLGGMAPTDNPFYAQRGVSTRKFIVGDLVMIRQTHLRYDLKLTLKEDYDYMLQHWQEYGGAVRCDDLMPSFQHRTNPGGAVAYRTPELEQETIRYLLTKWPGMLKLNPRRENEILLDTRKKGALR